MRELFSLGLHDIVRKSKHTNPDMVIIIDGL